VTAGDCSRGCRLSMTVYGFGRRQRCARRPAPAGLRAHKRFGFLL